MSSTFLFWFNYMSFWDCEKNVRQRTQHNSLHLIVFSNRLICRHRFSGSDRFVSEFIQLLRTTAYLLVLFDSFSPSGRAGFDLNAKLLHNLTCIRVIECKVSVDVNWIDGTFLTDFSSSTHAYACVRLNWRIDGDILKVPYESVVEPLFRQNGLC